MNSVKVDKVTKLPDIYAFIDTMHEQLRTKEYSAVMKIVLNRFQRINSIYSYEFGDKVLKVFAAGLQDLIRERGTIFRMDGTKFAICLRDVSEAEVMEVYEQVQNWHILRFW